MNSYVTGGIIRRLREENGMTQSALAEKINVSSKAVSKWETGKGYPDITLLEPLAQALGVSVIELMSGSNVTNLNRSFNMKKSLFYVCPICGNIILSTGEAVVCCCGVSLIPAECEKPDEAHEIHAEIVEDEYFITVPHEMNRNHYISFIAAVRDNGAEIVKLYPEGACEARFKINRTHKIYAYCNRHGLFTLNIPPYRKKID